MNTLHKLLNITGAICLSCICSTSKAEPKILTLEKLRTLLEQQCQEGTQNIVTVRKAIAEGNKDGFEPLKHGENNFSYCVPKKFFEKFKCVKHVEYNAKNEPAFLELINGGSLKIRDVLNPMSSRFGSYIRQKFSKETPAARLKRISKELATEELKKRGVTDAEGKLLGDALIREITFDSILGSDFFDNTHREKGELWFKNREELEKAIDIYAGKASLLQPVTCCVSDTFINLTTEISGNRFRIHEQEREPRKFNCFFAYKISGERAVEMKKILACNLKNLLRYKNGKEKVILLLLLEEMAPLEYCLKWMNENEPAKYDSEKNLVILDFKDHTYGDLSHEIGHYLQMQFGLRQTFGDYCMKFAENLLLLKPEKSVTCEKIHIPTPLLRFLKDFDDVGINSDELSEKDLFIHWQLISRWCCNDEISNMLGIYFNRAENMIFLHALSDIRERTHLIYGHDIRNNAYEYLMETDREKREFKTSAEQEKFKNIVEEAASKEFPMDAIALLCKLQGRTFDKNEILNSFDYDSVEQISPLRSNCGDLKTADE